ncbi:unannotated protein [freshwater metagenome]|uniref:Unannotated protein n=1 Tax=freshwater metagenome TaxID=449393 RepID=A0A6J6K8F0_9ZZZZ
MSQRGAEPVRTQRPTVRRAHDHHLHVPLRLRLALLRRLAPLVLVPRLHARPRRVPLPNAHFLSGHPLRARRHVQLHLVHQVRVLLHRVRQKVVRPRRGRVRRRVNQHRQVVHLKMLCQSWPLLSGVKPKWHSLVKCRTNFGPTRSHRRMHIVV